MRSARASSSSATPLAGTSPRTTFSIINFSSVPKVPEWERIATELRIVTEQVVRGELPAEGVAEELDARADRILEKRRWMLDRRAQG